MRFPAYEFQSLVRAYKRSDNCRSDRGQGRSKVSIPRSGLQAFRHGEGGIDTPYSCCVSIPRSGLQAFRPQVTSCVTVVQAFQSLVRAYKRSDDRHALNCACNKDRFQSLVRAYKRSDEQRRKEFEERSSSFNPSFGLTSVPTQ